MKSWGVGEGRSVLIFSEESDFQGPGVQNSPKLENRKIQDFGFSSKILLPLQLTIVIVYYIPLGIPILFGSPKWPVDQEIFGLSAEKLTGWPEGG